MKRYFKSKLSKLPDDFPTFEEMIESAKRRFDLPPEVWRPFDDAIARRAAEHKKPNENIVSLRDYFLCRDTEKVNEIISRHSNLPRYAGTPVYLNLCRNTPKKQISTPRGKSVHFSAPSLCAFPFPQTPNPGLPAEKTITSREKDIVSSAGKIKKQRS